MGGDHTHDHDHGHGPRESRSPAAEHRAAGPSCTAVQIVTVSDTRTAGDDTSGAALAEIFRRAGHEVRPTVLVKDDAGAITGALRDAETDEGVRAVVFNGGTGAARRDVTLEALAPLFEKPLPGFGEIFRALSFAEIGSAAFLSRAAAGIRGRRVVFALPGSTAAVRLAAERLIVPELGHIVRELDK